MKVLKPHFDYQKISRLKFMAKKAKTVHQLIRIGKILDRNLKNI